MNRFVLVFIISTFTAYLLEQTYYLIKAIFITIFQAINCMLQNVKKQTHFKEGNTIFNIYSLFVALFIPPKTFFLQSRQIEANLTK